ncbi:galactose oxidase-like domain-containing protein [Streptomyces polyrhachis]|uniref:Galactose oxidase-like domain-containing protein n=1 Tax=Streptomyces polyrhachis TaxID=1282885 RepID=A0ABW2GH41_9ACTN
MRLTLTHRTRRYTVGAVTLAAVTAFNGPAFYRYGGEEYHDWHINRPTYKAANGHWRTVDVPERHRINTIHAALLHTGKVLLIAGSGNDARQFDARTFRSVLWDPAKNTFRDVPTPADLFCSGHTQLADGRLLVAGGTQRYEKLGGDVKKAGGLMVVHNENPDKPLTLPAGTRFTGRDNHKTFESKDPLLVPRATKTTNRKTRTTTVKAATARVYVEALQRGRRHQTGTEDNYRINALPTADRRNVYGIAQKLSFDKKDFQGIKNTYEFDPVAERYLPVDDMNEARWYPTLTTLHDGRVLSVSGLDEIGQVVPGKNEVYDPATKKWTYLTKERFFPTYPALFLTGRDQVFYTGSNAGYGPADQGRAPGLWNLRTGAFTPVPGISDPDVLETSMSVQLPPAQSQRYMVLGGGGVGENSTATARRRLVDLNDPEPRFRNGPDLYAAARYPSSVILPDDTVLTTNGSGDYRGRGASDILRAELYDPATDTARRVADPLVGRNYHSGALLLPDGRVMTFGSDSLFADRANTQPGAFQQQIDLYTPPYLHTGTPRPRLRDTAPRTLAPGGSTAYRTTADVRTARLIRPGSFTHVTNVEQRSIALTVRRTPDGIRVTVPADPALVPPGWYMLTVTDGKGVPSEAVWVKVRAQD